MRRLSLLPVCAVLLAGCAAKLNFNQSFTLPDANNADYKQFDLAAQSGSQTVTAEVAVTGEPVDVYVVAAPDAGGFPDLGPDKKTEKALGSIKNTTGQSVTVTVPAKTAFSVFVFQAKTTRKPSEVTLRLKN